MGNLLMEKGLIVTCRTGISEGSSLLPIKNVPPVSETISGSTRGSGRSAGGGTVVATCGAAGDVTASDDDVALGAAGAVDLGATGGAVGAGAACGVGCIGSAEGAVGAGAGCGASATGGAV